jgi:hypothetical protein
MKTLFTSILSILVLSAYAQTNVVLNIEHRINQNPFAFNDERTAPGGYAFDVDRLEYYISDIQIVHDGGQTTDVDDVWLLVDAGNDVNFDLGDHSFTTIEGINFYIGVGPDVNNADPSQWPNGHALAPQNPSMHWGWSSGYRFVAMEGGAGNNTAFTYEVHALGNNNYNQVQITTDAIDNGNSKEIVIYADYARALNSIDVSSGLILHATNGQAITFLDNFADHVFFPASALSVEDAEFKGVFDVYPNPAESLGQVSYRFDEEGDYTISVLNAQGQLIYSERIVSKSGLHTLPEVARGQYTILLEKDGVKAAARKWMKL